MSPLSKLALAGLMAVAARAADSDASSSFATVTTKTSTAESHIVSAYWPDIANGNVEASVISAGDSATTYLICDDIATSCVYNYTLIAGPSTVEVHMSIESTYTVDLECNITTTASKGECTAYNSADGTVVNTSTSLSNFDDFRSNITVTAGYDKIAARTGSSSSPGETGGSNSDDNGDGNGDDDDSAAPGRMHGAALAGVVAMFGGLLML